MKKEILEKVTQERIFQQYFPEPMKMGKYYKNPIRVNDNSAGCYFTYLDDKLYFVDFANNPTHMDCFKFIELYRGLPFKDVLTQISMDFELNVHRPQVLFENKNLRVKSKLPKPFVLDKREKKDVVIKVINQAFSANDLTYWNSFGISLTTLDFFNVKPVYRAWIDEFLYHQYTNDDPIYRYREFDTFKLYRPLASKRNKFRTNMRGGTLEGWSQLPDKGDTLVITKSRKDVMCLYEVGIPSVSVRSESSIVSENAASLLSKRFKNIYSWFDNDEAGIKYSKIQCEKYGWNFIKNPEGFPKDPSDTIKTLGKKEFLKLKQSLIN